MGFFLDLLFDIFIFGTDWRGGKISEENICENIDRLKEKEWFQQFLDDEAYRQLIIHDHDVRNTIGRFNPKRLHKDRYNDRCEQKLYHLLYKKVQEGAQSNQ